MPVNLAVNDVLEIKLFTRNGGQTGINVLHYNVQTIGGGAITDQQVADAFSTFIAPSMKALMSTQSSYSGLRVQRISPLPVPVAVTSTNGAAVGTTGVDVIPAQASALISKRTNLAGRMNRGRVYLPFIALNHTTSGGQLNAGGLTAVGNWAAAAMALITIVAGGVTLTMAPVIWNRGPRTLVFVTTAVIRTPLATQRRRSLINRGDVVGP